LAQGGSDQPPAGGAPRASRTEAKNAVVRERLVPLAEGERPLPVTIGAIVTLALALVQIPLYLTYDGNDRPPFAGFLFFLCLMLGLTWGMWQVRYWAVLGFQALLVLVLLFGALFLMLASTLATAIICAAVVIPAGVLFWFMVKALARIQMPAAHE
jgi:hypothetical protein